LTVAVFGGSVASKLVHPPQNGLSLLVALQERPEFSGRNITIYSMAQGAAKQPQQVMALVMLQTLGQRPDIVLNLDGYNEFGIGYENVRYSTHPIFPSLAFLWQIGSELQPKGKARKIITGSPICRFTPDRRSRRRARPPRTARSDFRISPT
jgi:hypothetical protein